MNKTTILIIVDAGQFDYINSKDAPYISNLKKNYCNMRIKSPPGFAQRSAMFTGTFPDTSHKFSAYKYDPKNSPFKWIKKSKVFSFTFTPRKIIYPLRLIIKKITELTTNTFYADPAWIPSVYLPYFDIAEDKRPIYEKNALGIPSIFDLMIKDKLNFTYLIHPVCLNDEQTMNKMNHFFSSGKHSDLILLQFAGQDIVGHKYGPNSLERRMNLRKIDNYIKEIIQKLESRYKEVNTIIVGDHGMSPVREWIDIKKLIESKKEISPGKDYIMFLDSTVAKFWFNNDKAKSIIVAELKKVKQGYILTDEKAKKMRIYFGNRDYGDLMFFMKPYYMIFPDYFHIIEHKVKGMHGYLKDHKETYGFMIIKSEKSKGKEYIGKKNLVSVFPTLCSLLNIKIPKTNEGKTLLK